MNPNLTQRKLRLVIISAVAFGGAGAAFNGFAATDTESLAPALLMTMNAAWPACTVSAVGINFGSYDPFFQQNLDSTGSVEVSCDVTTTYSIALSPGRGTYTSRAMSNGSHELLYNLYTNVAHATLWGDGTAGTATVDASGMDNEHTVYGSIPARQNALLGNYSDTIVVTLTF